mgnify:CR=1 FL=1
MSEDAAGPQTAQAAAVEAYWATARKRAGLDRLDVVVGQQPLGTVPPPAWSFGSDPTTAIAANQHVILENLSESIIISPPHQVASRARTAGSHRGIVKGRYRPREPSAGQAASRVEAKAASRRCAVGT